MDEKEVEDNYSAHQPTAFGALDPTDQNAAAAAAAAAGGSIEMVDYMLNTSPAPPPPPPPHLSFAEVMQFADFRPKVHAQIQTNQVSSGDVVDVESCFFKFPSLPSPSPLPYDEIDGGEDQDLEEEEAHRFSDLNAAAAVAAGSSVQEIGGGGADQGKSGSRRKRGRSMKTSEEVESQRMTHIAVERNRRRQMNEHLRVLRALMPTSYVQRGDQASIIGGAIEFVRELEQLLQCLESQKRRRLYGSGGAVDAAVPLPMPQPPPPPLPPFFPQLPLAVVDTSDGGGVGLREDMAENKSSLADIEVRLLGLDAMIKILSRRRPGQLLRTIAALEDMQLSILHTNITTIEQTVLYSFNVKITAETSCTAQEIANSVQQILGFIDDSREHY